MPTGRRSESQKGRDCQLPDASISSTAFAKFLLARNWSAAVGIWPMCTRLLPNTTESRDAPPNRMPAGQRHQWQLPYRRSSARVRTRHVPFYRGLSLLYHNHSFDNAVAASIAARKLSALKGGGSSRPFTKMVGVFLTPRKTPYSRCCSTRAATAALT